MALSKMYRRANEKLYGNPFEGGDVIPDQISAAKPLSFRHDLSVVRQGTHN